MGKQCKAKNAEAEQSDQEGRSAMEHSDTDEQDIGMGCAKVNMSAKTGRIIEGMQS